jgi:pyruvate-formate lyase-activating enzyme
LDFSYEILARSKAEGVHTASRTDANYAGNGWEKLLAVTDFVMTDIKHMDSAKNTGKSPGPPTSASSTIIGG